MGVSGAVNLNATEIPNLQVATINAGSNDVTFNTTVEGPGGLVVNTSGTTKFTGTIGLTSPLASIQTDDALSIADATLINGGLVHTSGAQNFGDRVSANNLTMTSGGTITAVNSANDFSSTLVVTAGGDTHLVDANSLSLGKIDITGSATFEANNGSIVTGGVGAGFSATGSILLVAKDATGGNFGTVTIGTGGLMSGTVGAGQAIEIHAADDITVSAGATGVAGVYSNGGQITLLAGQSAGMLGNQGTEVADNFGAVTINGPLNAGAGNVLIVTAGHDAVTPNSASQSDIRQGAAGQITAGILTAVTLKGSGGVGNGGASIILNTASPANDATAINLFSCPEAGCPIQIAPGETQAAARARTAPFITAPNVNDVNGGAYAAGQLEYSDISGVNVSGIGTVSDFAIVSAGPMTVSASGISASNLTFEATGTTGDITIDLSTDLLQINGTGTGSLRFIAGGFIHMLESSATIGSAGTAFNHHLDFIAAGNISIDESIRQATKNLLFAANQSGTSTVAADGSTVVFHQTLAGTSSGGVTLQGSHTVSTGGNVTVRGVDFSLLSGGSDPNRSHTGQELIAAGTVNLLNSGVITVKAGTSTGLSDNPFGNGARLQGGTVNIGSAGTPASNPTQLVIWAGDNNNVGYSTADPNDPNILLRQANAVVVSQGDMNVYLGSAPGPAGVPLPPSLTDEYSLVVRGGTSRANNSGANPLVVTAIGALQAENLVLETNGHILFQGGTATLETANAAAVSSALLKIGTDKTITTKNGGSVVLMGGTANVSATDAATNLAMTSTAARNSQAMAQIDPSKLTMTVDGILVLQGGKTTGPQGALASARIDAGDEIKITVNGTGPYTYSPSGGGSATLTGSSFYMIGGSDSGFFDANNVDLAGSLAYPQAFPITVSLAGGFQKVFDSGLAAGVVQTGLITFDDSLLSYVIFAANVETRALRFRRDMAESDDIGAPACR